MRGHPVWLPRDARLSAVQSALEEFYVKAGAVETSQAQGAVEGVAVTTDQALKADWLPSDSNSLGREGEESDWLGWGLSFGVARNIRLFRGKAKFRSNGTTIPFHDKARLVLCADWASGLPRAGQVALKMAKFLFDTEGMQRDRHVIHLGDVYYAGRDHEYRSHVTDLWPVPPGSAIGSYALNANHDMFAGGQGFYRLLDEDNRFARQAGASFFCLENQYWQIFGLDTAYESEGASGDLGGLMAPQAEWLMQHRLRAPQKKVILLSHHQLFSSYEKDSPLLKDRLTPLLSGPKPVDAWFWGHEHRCAVYRPSHNITYPALIGHGGVPVYANHETQPDTVRFQYDEAFRAGLEKFARLGFAVVDLDEDQAYVRYVNELGTVHEQHRIE